MKTMVGVVLVLCFSAALGCRAEEAKQNEKPLDEVKKEVAEGKAVIVDVREQGEWAAGHVTDAKLVPLSELKANKADLAALPKDKTIYTYCVMGKRSLTAAGILNEKGYHATSLTQGFDDLSKNGFEATK